MKKRLGIALAFVSALFFIYFTCFSGGRERLYDMSIDEMQFKQIKATHSQSPISLIQELYFNDEKLFFDSSDNMYYYSLLENCKSAFNPYVRKKSSNTSVKLAFLDEKITSEDIKENHAFRLIAYDEGFYSEYNLKCTLLPIMNINYSNEIERDNVPMDMTLFDNRAKALQRITTSNGNIHVRGASTSAYPKKSFKISLIQSSIGNHPRLNKVSLLDMRQDDDWILYPAYNDQEKIRNVFSSNLWKYTCAKDNSLGIDNGMEYKYIELFMNGKYWGLYALGYPIDELQLGIDFDENEHLYKKISYDKEEFTPDLPNTPISGYETTETPNDDWLGLKQYYVNLHLNQSNSKIMYQGIDVDNAIDMFLFINFIQGWDQIGALGCSSIKNMYLSTKNSDGNKILLYTPWDLDITWGNEWTDNLEQNFVMPYNISSSYNAIMEHGNLQALFSNGDEKLLELVLTKYHELRQGLWSEDSINLLLDEYEEDIYGSGAYLRDMERWINGTYSDADMGLSIFRKYVKDRIRKCDEYYKRFEKLYDKGLFVLRSAQYENFLDCNFIIEINSKDILKDKEYNKLFDYMGLNTNLIEDDTHFIIINGINKRIEFLPEIDKIGDTIDTSIGLMEIITDDLGKNIIYINGEKWLETNVKPYSCVQMAFETNDGIVNFDFTKQFVLQSYLLEYEPLKYINLIRREGYDLVIEILNNNVMYEEKFMQLINALDIKEQSVSSNTDFIIIDSINQECTILNNSHVSGSRNKTVIGDISVFFTEKNGYGVYVNNNECIAILDPELNNNVDIRVAVVNREPFDVVRYQEILY